ncbi:hypothetical protein SEVIR_5G069600v4 [Setaria viridis]|uniref:NmrA-like domain-containing protein n=1 Tax=Setaria viridis TaxID=4556 RepID=A0A4U6UAR7_SETVI|nr:hypothetical protein SEVIR_5G069600v2 [Setaria viridis]
MAAEKSRILVVGGTGYLGWHVVAASARLGHPTLALVRDTAPSDAAKAALLKSFQDAGVTLLKGDLDDHAGLVSAVKLADVVISTVGIMQIPDQTKLAAAIKEAGNVKTQRFFPSEFGLDADRSDAVEPTRSLINASKAAIRRAVEAAGVPTCWPANSSATGCPASGRSCPSHPRSTRPSSSATATRGWCSWTRRTSRHTRCSPPATPAPRTGRCTSGRRPTRCRTTSSCRCGRGRPAGRSSGCTSPRTPCSRRTQRLRFH